MDRRYRMELQMVRVPVVWKAKVPEKKLFPVTRKVPEERAIRRRNLAAVKMFMARMLDGAPDWMRPNEYKVPMPKRIFIAIKRPLPPWEDE